MCRGEGVNKVFFVAEVGHGHTEGAVDQDRAVGDADAGTHGQEPIGVHFLCDGEVGGSAARIGGCAGKVIVVVQGPKIAFKAKDPMAGLEVVASRAAAGETARAQQLMAVRGNGRNAAQSEVTCGTKNCTGKRVGPAFEATGVGADIKAIPILSITRCDQGKNQHAASQHESLHVNPSKILKYVDYVHSIQPEFRLYHGVQAISIPRLQVVTSLEPGTAVHNV